MRPGRPEDSPAVALVRAAHHFDAARAVERAVSRALFAEATEPGDLDRAIRQRAKFARELRRAARRLAKERRT